MLELRKDSGGAQEQLRLPQSSAGVKLQVCSCPDWELPNCQSIPNLQLRYRSPRSPPQCGCNDCDDPSQDDKWDGG